jgi:DNA/RNA endonuclease YhcR with UshA esterase domain
MSKRLFTILLTLIIILAACTTPPESPPSPVEEVTTEEVAAEPETEPVAEPAPVNLGEPAVLISEVLTGVNGNNNLEFIELYNSGTQAPFDLAGWSIWYQLADGQDEVLVYRWSDHTLIPPQGHYLLVREGQEVGVNADVYFTQPLVGPKGALQLRQTDGTVLDSLSWGTGPAAYAEGNFAPAMENGIALERLPGSEAGNWTDSNDNAADFVLGETYTPQNTGSALAPASAGKLSLVIEAPENATPGSEYDYVLTITNETGQDVSAVTVQLPIVLDLEVTGVPDDVEITDTAAFWGLPRIGNTHHVAVWTAGYLPAGDTATTVITVATPYTVFVAEAANYSVQANNWPAPTFGAPVRTVIEGGVIPIGTLVDLVGSEMTVEGTVTIQTGAMYAGGGHVKFYLEDETGGVQVWVPDGEGVIHVNIGAKARAHGELTLYRGALELIVNDLKDVEVLAGPPENEVWPAAQVSIGDALNDANLQGRLGQVEGLVTRVEEFSYSYELDIMNEAGEFIKVYVDKLTNINVESIEPGQYFKVTGIIEIYNTDQQIYSRVQSDFQQVYPPMLLVEMDAPISVATEDTFEVSLTAYNHTLDTLTDVTLVATLPLQGAQYISTSEGGDVSGSQIIWTIPELAGNGESISVSYEVQATATDGFVTFGDYQATAVEWEEPATGLPHYVFMGGTVPIWAIQGPGSRSPYILDPVVTAGTVTGIFPELGGFWIQETKTDKDPLTSAGLFINTGGATVNVAVGDTVQIEGVVRETSQQTQILISDKKDATVLQEGGALPTAVELDPPADEIESVAYYEALEGMLVQVSQPALAVGPQSKYGEYMLVLPKHGVTRLWQGDTDQNGLGIMVDDGSAEVHADRSGLDYVVNAGDRVSKLFGPLAYTFGKFKIEPVTMPTVDPGVVELPTLAATGSDEFSIMTWNVENLFDTRDPHPSDPPRPKASEYKQSIAKVANTIVASGAPTIVGLQEVENIGVLEDIAEHEALAGYDYVPALIEGTDSRGIDVGYLVRSDVAKILNESQHVAPEGLTSRPPLLIEVEIETDSSPVTVFVANNHFTSMSAGVEATEPRRNAQAAWNVTVLEDVQKENPEALVAIIGDLNSFYDALPNDTLREAGLQHIFEIIPEVERYSYIYQGASQTLDHILVTPTLFEYLVRTEVLHTNADYAPPEVGDESPMRKSDHDPVVATFSLSK